MDDPNIHLFAVTHKKLDNTIEKTIENNGRLIIGVRECKCYPYSDSIGSDNISYKNKYYSELSALYWIWKQKYNGIIGLEHYHRFFLNDSKQILSKQEAIELIKSNDVILSKPIHLHTSIKFCYFRYHHISDYNKLCKILIQQSTNQRKLKKIIRSFSRSKSFSPCNLMICSSKFLDDYCSWLFPALFELEKKINLGKHTGYQERVFGYLSERFINVFVKYNDCKVVYCETSGVDKEKSHILSSFFYNIKAMFKKEIGK